MSRSSSRKVSRSRALRRAGTFTVEQLEQRLFLSVSVNPTLATPLRPAIWGHNTVDTGGLLAADQSQPLQPLTLSSEAALNPATSSLQSSSISAAAQQALLQGLNQLKTLAPSMVGGAAWSALLPLVGQSVASQVDGAGLVTSLLQPAINALGGTQSLTTDNLVTLLQQAAITAGTGVSATVGTVTGGLDSTNNQLIFDAPVTATHTVSLELDAGQIASAMGIALSGDATVNLTVSLTVDLTFGASLNSGIPTSQQFFTKFNSFTATASVNASNISGGVNLGLLKASISNGSASLNGKIQVTLNGADSNGNVTLAQLTSTPAAQMFNVQTQGSASATLPVSASLSGLAVSGTPTISLQSNDPFSGRSMVVTTNSDFDVLKPFENASAGSVLTLLKSLATDLTQLGKNSDVGGSAGSILSTKIPFTSGKTVRDLLNLGQTFQDKVITPLSTAGGTPNFSDAQGFLSALGQALGAGTSASYDPVSHRITFQVNIAENFTALTVPMSFDVNLGALGGINSSTTVTITPGASLNMSVAIDLTPSDDVLTAISNVPSNGQLPSDAHFSIDLGAATGLNGVDVPIAVTIPADPTNQTIDDLVADVNTALAAAGLGSLVTAGKSGNRITLSTTYSSTAASLGIQVPSGDAASTVLGLLNGATGASGTSLTDRLVLQNATAKGTISVNTPGGVNASAHYGFLGVAINNGTANANAEADLSLQDPVTHLPSGNLTLTQIAAALASPTALVSSLNVSGSANANLPITVTPAILGTALSGSPALTVAIADIKNLAGAVVTTPQLGNLNAMANMTFADALAGLNQLVSYLQSLAPLPEFNGKLPLINKSVDDLLGYTQKLLNVINQIANSPDQTIQSLSTDLNSKLAASGVHNATVKLSVDNDAIKAAIHYQPLDYSGTQAFDLSLQDLANLLSANDPAKAALSGLGDLAQIGATGTVSAKASADLELDLGIRLTTDPNDATRTAFTPFMYDSSQVLLTAQLDATNLNANVNLGPVGLFIQNGSAHLTKQTQPQLVEAPAELGLTLRGISSHRYYFDQVLGAVTPVLQGQLSMDLPLASPLVTNSIGDLTASADLSNIAGTINVTAPDLAAAMSNFDLLSNLGVVVDGLDALLGVVQDGLTDLAFIKTLPLIGNHLQDAFTFISDLRSTLHNTLEPLVQNPGGDAITEARKLIAQALGSALSDTNGDGVRDYNDVPVTTSDTNGDGIVDKVEFEVPIDKTVTTSVPFDLGLPALNLSAVGNVLVTANAHLDLKFGVSSDDGFFIDTSYPQGNHAISASVSVSVPATVSGTLGFLHVNVQDLGLADGNSADSTNFSAGINLDLKQPSSLSSPDVPFTDLVGGTISATDLASVALSGSAAVNLRLGVDFGDEGDFPHIQADLHVNWGFNGDPDGAANLPSVGFDNIRLDLGTFLSNLLGPVVSKIQDVLNPIMPVLKFLNSDVPILDKIAGKPISWAEVLIGDGSLIQDLTGGRNVDSNSINNSGTAANYDFIRQLLAVAQLANEIPVNGGQVFVDLGSFSLAGDMRDPTSDVSKLANFASSTVDDVKSELAGLQVDGNSTDGQDASVLGDSQNLDGTGGGFDFPLFDDPTQAFKLLLGQDISLVTFTPPQLDFNRNFSFDFSPFWPLTLTFGGDLSGQSHIQFGYDTHGLHKFLSDKDPLELLDGFYASSSGTASNGTALPELNLHLDMYVSGGLDADVASLVAKGQLNVDVTANLNDPNGDGKVHGDEIAYELKNASDLGDKILSVVDLQGSIGWSVDITGKVGPFSKSFQVASDTIADFDTNAVRNGTTLSDRFEPNDTQAAAADLGVAPGIHVGGMSLHSAGDTDFYKFAIVRNGAVNVTLSYASGYTPGAIEFDVLDAKGNVVATGRGSGDNVTAQVGNTGPGTYYIKVFGAGQSVAGSYSLAIDPAPGGNQHVYYVNDSSTANSYYTTAAGDDANSGTDPSQPKATIQAILNSYTLGPDDIIVVDSGTYSTAVTMAAAQAGVAIYGAPQKQSTFQNASLALAGGGTLFYGFAINNAPITVIDAGGTTGAIIENNAFTGNSQLNVTGSADIESNTFGLSASPAIFVSATTGEKVTILNNTISGGSIGMDVEGSGVADIENNSITGATFYGIEATVADGSIIGTNSISLTNATAGIRVSGGSATIQNNTITGSGTYGIDVFNGDGDSILNNTVSGQATGIFSGSLGAITVNDNQITGTTTAGINLANTVSADVKANTINPNAGVALEIGGGTAHTVSQNNIGGSGSTAIWLQNSASGNVDYNVIASGYATDIEVDGSGTSDVSYNKFSNASTYAIYFAGGGSHSATHNTGTTSSNATAAIRADGGANAIESNTFTGTVQRGVYLAQSAYGQIDGNTFGTTSNTGIEVDGTGLTSITNNSFGGAGTYGIYVPNASSVTVQGNSFSTTGSTAPGILLNSNTGSTSQSVTQNTITGSGKTAIWLQGTTSASVDNNSVATGFATDVEIDGAGNSEVTGNSLAGATTYAIYFTGGGNHTARQNTGSTSNASAVIRSDGGTNTILSNTFTGSAQRGIYLYQSASGQVDHNTLGTTSNTGIEVDGTGTTSITNNQFSSATVYGIYVPDATNVTVRNNTLSISSSTAQGIRLDVSTGPAVSGNQITGSGAIGIHLGTGASSAITGNSVSGSAVSIQYDGTAAADFENNTLSGSSTAGVYVPSASALTALNNHITANSGNGIEYDATGPADVESNQVQGTRSYGIYLKNLTTATILSNQVTVGSNAGISATANAAMDVESNTVSGSGTYGIVLNTPTSVILKSNQVTTGGGQGIQATAGSVTTLYQNIVNGNGGDAILVTAASVGPVTGNTVNAGNGQGFGRGMALATTTTGAITANNISGAITGIEFDGTGSLDAESNTIARSSSYAIYAPSAVGVTALTNTINALAGSGLWLGGAGIADIENNPAIKGTGVYGIYLPNVTGATIQSNTMQMNAGTGIRIESGSGETIIGNTLSGSGSYGFYLTANASGVIKNNTIGVANSANIRYDSATVPADFENNTLSGSTSYGIYLTAIGGTLLNNTIGANSGTGIEADGPGTLDIEGNSGAGFGGYNAFGIRVTSASSSTIKFNNPIGLNGAQTGIEVDAGTTAIANNVLTGSSNYGIYTAANVSGPITGNTLSVAGDHGIWFNSTVPADIENNTVNGSGQHGIYVPNATSSTILNNSVAGTGSSTGIRVDTGTTTISNNTVAGSGAWGIYLPTATTATVTDNQISGQTTGLYSDRGNAVVYGNKIHDNTTGVVSRGQIGGNDWSDPNLIYNNTAGVNMPVSTTLQFNRLYGNATAIAAAPYSNINHDVIYRNTTAGIFASGANNMSIVNNTIYAPAGDAIRLVASSTGATIENNILWSQAGYDLYVSLDSVSGLSSDYNNLYTTGAGKVAFDVIDFTDVLDWMLAGGQDAHSIGTTRPNPTLDDPKFVNMAGDDYHLTNVVSTSIDGGDPNTPYNLEPAPNGGRVDLGAYGGTSQAATSISSFLYLDSPRMYLDWVASSFQYIQWHSFNVTGNIDIEVDKEGAGKVADIAVVPVTDGQYLWSPQTSGLPADDSRYRIKITSVSNPSVFTSSREAFAVPNQTHSYYVNDSSTTNDVYTSAIGDNRNTGTSAADPKPSIAAVLRPYDLGAQDTIYVDTGHYIELQNLVISGIPGVGDDEGVTITGPTNPTKQAILDRAYPYSGAYAMQLNNADFTTVKNLTLTGGEIGLWVENGSTQFTGSNLTVTGNTHDGLRIESDSTNPLLDSITATNNGRYGIYSAATLPALEHSTIANNADTGLYLQNPGNAEIGANTIYGNGTGIYLFENDSASPIIGDPNLSDGTVLGNLVYDNSADGIDASGQIRVAGNTVYGQTSGGKWGISFSGGTVSNNVVYSNSNGIISYGGTLTANRVYANSGTGIDLYYGSTATQNVSYSNATGIYVASNSTVANNLVYANSQVGIQLQNASGTHVTNNTVYQSQGDAVHVGASGNVDIRNNILYVATGSDISVGSDSQSGFTSDYNLLYATGAGVIGTWQGLTRTTLAAWQNASFTDSHSLSQDPRFVSPAGADGQLGYASAASDGRDDDFHLQSTMGAPTSPGFAPVLGAGELPVLLTAGLVNSAATSPAIDRGDPSSSFAQEPAPNGGYVDLGAYGDTTQASRSATSYVRVISPDGGEVWPQGQTFTIQWRTENTSSQATGTDTFSIDLMRVGNSTPVLNIASGITNAGQLNWTVPSTLNPESDYLIRVTRNGTQIGTSDNPFTIAAPIHLYYVNDGTVNAGDYTTAPGDDANDGLSPATPKASIRSVLAAYHLGPNDVILVDAGTYLLDSNIVITAASAGITIRGYSSTANPSESTVLNRNNTASGSYVFELQGASGITLDHLTVTGGQYGVYASTSSGSNNVTISNSVFYANPADAIYLPASNDSPVVNHNDFSGYGLELSGNSVVFTNNAIHDTNDYARLVSSNLIVTGNTGYNTTSGTGAILADSYTTADIENNVFHDNYVGLSVQPLTRQTATIANNQFFNNGTGVVLNGDVTNVFNNIVYGNTSYGINGGTDIRGNTVFDNANGINSGGLIEGNYVYGNTVGIIGSNLSGNHVYDNVTGVVAGNGLVTNNLIYDNATSIYISGNNGGRLVNNTIVQTNGADAVVVVSHPALSIRNNIFDVSGSSAHAVNISTDSENGFDSDYNFYDLNNNAAIGVIGGNSYTSLAAWNYQLNLDRHSGVGDPQFNANPAGPDGILGSVGGLNGSYYASTDLSGTPVLQRVDSVMNFNWNGNSPGGGVPGGAFSAKWTGYINVPASGTYTFSAIADDGVRLFLDNSSIATIDQWSYINNATDTASVTLAAGLHPIEIDYRQLGGGSRLWLAWSGPGVLQSTLMGNVLSPQNVAPGNYGLDDSFNVVPGSPTIDAGDPNSPYLSEPVPNGARINQGYTGNTSQAITSNAQTVQVVMPNGLEKLTAYDPVLNLVTYPITVRSTGLAAEDAVVQINAGGPAVGSWMTDSYMVGQPNGGTNGGTIDTSAITRALAPASVYQSYQQPYGTGTLTYVLPVPYDTDNSYRLTLEFVDYGANVGQRVFDIKVNGTTVASNYDIRAAAGASYKATELTFPVTAVAGQGIRLDLVQDGNGLSPIISAISLTHVNPSGQANPTVSLSYSTDGGSTYTPIASGVPLDATGSATYNWQVPATYTNKAIVKVTSDSTGVSDTSDQPFLIVPASNTYYVNDGSQTGDVYTTAPGNDANTGKTPDSPMATLGALLAAYSANFKPGDIIEVDTGYYPLQANIVLTASEKGATILGPTGAGAVFDRQSFSGGSYTFNLAGASNVTLKNLSITGGQFGVYAGSNSYSTGVTIDHSNIYGNQNTGIDFEQTNDNVALTNDTIWGNPAAYPSIQGTGANLVNIRNITLIGNFVHDSTNTGIFAEAQNIVATNNTAANNGTGLYLYNINPGPNDKLIATGNVTYGSYYGITLNGQGTASGNIAYDNTIGVTDSGTLFTGNTVYRNSTGINNQGSIVSNNRVYLNSTGITTAFGGTMLSNYIYNNTNGIVTAAGVTINNNLIYANNQYGVWLQGGSGGTLLNNTIVQTAGDDVRLDDASGLTIENNILQTSSGYALQFTDAAESGVHSDYNLFNATGSASMVYWGGTVFNDQPTLAYATGQDRHSHVGNPGFVNPAGADGLLGYFPGGLAGTYYGTSDLSGPVVLTRTDSNFYGVNYNNTPPAPGLSANVYSMRWVGYINVPASGTYTFSETSDDGLRLYLAGASTPVIDQWNYDYGHAHTGVVALSAGWQPIEIDYHNIGGNGGLSLSWSGPTFGMQPVYDNVLSPNLSGTSGGDYGQDDNFQLAPGSIAIDAGDPNTPYVSEPANNGARVDQGAFGGTPSAYVDSATTLQVLSPGDLQKVQPGQSTNITWQFGGVGLEPIARINAGGGAVGNFLADSYLTVSNNSSSWGPVPDLSGVSSGLPASAYQDYDYARGGVGNELAYQLPVPDGTYTIILNFDDSGVGGPNQRNFNILLNGVDVQPNFDIYAAAGGRDKAVDMTYTVNVTGGTGLRVELVNVNTNNVAIISGVELYRNTGVAVPGSTELDVSTDNGQTWHTITTNATTDANGHGVFSWDPTGYVTSGNTAIIRATGGGVTAYSDGTFLIAPSGHSYYVNDSLTGGDVYATAPGNNANSGKAPSDPVASISVLLDNYNLGPSDTIYVDTGVYDLYRTVQIGASAAGVHIAGPAASTPGANSYRDIVAADHPSAYYRLGETAGATTAADLTGNNPATYSAGVTLGQAGPLAGETDTAASFDGVSGHVTLPAGFADFSQGLTFELWAYPTQVNNNQTFIELGDGSAGNRIVFGRSGITNNLIFQIFNGTSLVGTVTANNAIQLNTWQEFAVTMAPSINGSGGNIALYKNGQQIATGSMVMPAVVSRTTNYLGQSTGTGDRLYAGLLDEVAIYPRALSDLHLMAHFLAASRPMAFIDRDSTNYNVFNVSGASNADIEHLTIAGGHAGIAVPDNAYTTGVQVRGNTILGNYNDGLYVGASDTGAVVTGNEMFGLPFDGRAVQYDDVEVYGYGDVITGNNLHDAANNALYLNAAGSTISNNQLWNSGTGAYIWLYGTKAGDPALVSGNVIHNNSGKGIVVNYGLATGNTAYSNSTTGIEIDNGTGIGNTAYGNGVGISGGSSTLQGNVAYSNSTGMAADGSTLSGNRLYSNAVGLDLGTTSNQLIVNNLVYANTEEGIWIKGGNADRLLNNTVDQLVGDALRLENVQSLTAHDNILQVQSGRAVYTASIGAGVDLDYNDLVTSADPNAAIGLYNGTAYTTLASWQTASGRDAHSISADPKFVDPDGADNILGVATNGSNYNGGSDDNFSLSAGSPAIDHGDSWNAAGADITGSARQDDPGTVNAGSPDYVSTDTGSSQFAATGTAQNWRQPGGGYWQLNLPFNFSFFGQSYNVVYVSTNGFIQLGTNSGMGDLSTSLSHASQYPRIAALSDNLVTNGSGNDIFVSSSSGQVTVRWAATHLPDNGSVNFAITLFPDGTIRFDYGSGNASLTPLIGLFKGDGLIYRLAGISGQASLANADSIQFTTAPGFTDIGAFEFRGSSSDATGPTIVNTRPSGIQSGTFITTPLSTFTLSFSEPINAIDATALANYDLRSPGPDGIYGTVDDVVIPLSVSYDGAEKVTLTPLASMPIGPYRLTVRGSAGTAIHDLSGNSLDGDNNGAPGGDYVRTFFVRLPNTAPVVAPLADVSIPFGTTFTANGSFTDTDAYDSWTATVDYGDGNGPQALVFDPVKQTFALSRQYAQPGTYTVTVLVTDAANTSGQQTLHVKVIAPAPNLAGPVIVNDGSPQRSVVTSLTLSFDRAVNFNAAGFTLAHVGDGSVVPITMAASADRKTLTISFASLNDGNYQLNVASSAVWNDDQIAMTAPVSFWFFRVLGDLNGDGNIDVNDFVILSRHYGQTGPAGNGDLTGDGSINLSDLTLLVRNFGHGVHAAISGSVFNDANNNGLRDAGEQGLAGVTIYLDANNNGRLDPGELSTLTDGSGNYSFAGLLNGSYVVREVLPAGYAQTCPIGYAAPVSAVNNRSVAAPIFGDVLISSVIMNQSYFTMLSRNFSQAGTFATGDLNGDGTVDLADLLLLTRNFGHAIPTTGASVLPAATGSPTNSSSTVRRR